MIRPDMRPVNITLPDPADVACIDLTDSNLSRMTRNQKGRTVPSAVCSPGVLLPLVGARILGLNNLVTAQVGELW
jgi:hypothetical protein